ncbi:MAG: DNA-formamidopyrimidine glycosylase [Fidelibacterota bacterium]
MPELPEVETIVKSLLPVVQNKKITDVRINFPKVLATHKPAEFSKLVIGKKINTITRRGKYIVFHLSGNWVLILHLRMTGKLIIAGKNATETKHDHLIISLDNGKRLFYNDTRKFGRFYLTQNPQEKLGKLGPEPLGEDFKFKNFSKKLQATQRKIKAVLLDQNIVAGLGNIYTDEALFEAGIHPEQPASTISRQKQKKLFFAIQNVLRKGIQNKGTSLGDGQTNYVSSDSASGSNQYSLQVFARTGLPCPKCQRAIKKIIVAQRGTHYCSNCQRIRKR